jgi:hypothetical protein
LKSRFRAEIRQRTFITACSRILAASLTFAVLCGLTAEPSLAKHKDKEEKTEQSAPPEVVRPSAAALASQKLLKTMKTPFTVSQPGEDRSSQDDPLSSLTLSAAETRPHRLSLSERLVPPQLFLPGHMILGKTVEFTVKGKPGSWAALAMADKNSGAKPILGRTIRLGPDRKVVGLGQIPSSGILVLSVDTPIEGDLIGDCLYFEAATWSKPDMSDTEIASVVPSESQPSALNGVLIAADNLDKKKKGIRLVPDSVSPIMSQQRSGTAGLESGKP